MEFAKEHNMVIASHAEDTVNGKLPEGEYVAVREMRKHIAWYLKGLRNSARIRDEINKIESHKEVVDKLNAYMQDCLTLE